MNNDNTQTSNKTTRNIFLAVLAVALLAGAAFVGGSLLRKQETDSKKDDFKIIDFAVGGWSNIKEHKIINVLEYNDYTYRIKDDMLYAERK